MAEREDKLTRARSVRQFVVNLEKLMGQGDGTATSEERQIGHVTMPSGEGEVADKEAVPSDEGEVADKEAAPIVVWDEQAWKLLVNQVTIYADGRAEFLFRGENKVEVSMTEEGGF